MARTKSHYAGVYERNDTDGKSYYFIISTTDPKTGKRRQKKYGGYKDKATAYKDLTDLKAKLNKGKYIHPTKITLKEWLDKWVGKKELTFREVTLESYKNRIKHIVEDYGNLQLYSITSDIFTDLHGMLLQKKKVIFNGKEKITTNEGLSSRTIHDTLKVLKMALIQAYEDDLLPKNITKSYKLPPEGSKDHNVLKPDEVPILLEVAKNDPMYAAIYIAVTTGMRESEILGLKWDAVDFDNGHIEVKSTLNGVNGVYTVSNRTKTPSSKRTIEIDDEIIDVLKKQYHLIQSYKENAQDMYQNNNLVCPTSNGTPVNPSNLRRSFYRILKRAGVTRVTFHELRHSHLTHLLIAGVDPKITSFRAGHSSTRVTSDIYQHVLKGVQRGALVKYREIINPKN
ncbi:site-specific integrase [Paenibacillus qinlingensis]|uniref:site-specific integrase n=1 Tax=Paenibacillus qinlingensis TaxID=1837343 RepID=UPI0015643022|nr:site-specific integrase [Paenibacillus qinlingensis]NQX62171.1 site-specific integrase [Paenibacillus qinlingensis]